MEEEKKPLLFNLPYVKDLWEDREQVNKDCARVKDTMLQGVLASQKGKNLIDIAKSNHRPLYYTPEARKAMEDAWLAHCKPIFRNVLIAEGILDLYNWMNSVPSMKLVLIEARRNVKYERVGDLPSNNNPFILE